MNRTRIILIFILLPVGAFSQAYINKSKNEVKKELDKSPVVANGAGTTTSETDSSVTRKLRGPGEISTDEIYIFDKSGKCSSERTTTNSDSCYKILLNAVLGKKEYGWKLININQYVSKFSAGLFLETQTSGKDYSFVIFKTNLDKKMYKFLMEDN